MEINTLVRRHAAAWTLLNTANALVMMVMHRTSPNPGLRDLDALHFELIAFGVGREEPVEMDPRANPPVTASSSCGAAGVLRPERYFPTSVSLPT